MTSKSIEWLWSKMKSEVYSEEKYFFASEETLNSLFEQAKEIHKQEMEQQFQEGSFTYPLPQQEISDEVIDKAKESAWSDFEYDNWVTFKGGWDLAIKWYREQLKSKGNGES